MKIEGGSGGPGRVIALVPRTGGGSWTPGPRGIRVLRPERARVPPAAPPAAAVGYSRAVRVGNHIYAAATAPVGDDGQVLYPGDPYRQARRCLEIITAALAEAGAGPEAVVRTRTHVTDASHWREVGRAHGEF